MTNKTQTVLEFKAQFNNSANDLQLDYRRRYLQKLQEREDKQRKNIHGIVQYAKQIAAEIGEYNTKVESSEKIVYDLNNSGNETVDNLMDMLKKYKREIKSKREEVAKQNDVSIKKDSEILDLN